MKAMHEPKQELHEFELAILVPINFKAYTNSEHFQSCSQDQDSSLSTDIISSLIGCYFNETRNIKKKEHTSHVAKNEVLISVACNIC